MASRNWKVLSIQSHVVSGYVGNKSATFPLQVLGFEVDTINSVQFSNHTGYKVFKGQILDEKDIVELVDALIENDLHKSYTHLLTGYVRSPSFLHAIAKIVKQLKEANPGLVYVCDPVMGDNGKLYVPESLLEIYKKTIVPLADILTPNQFETELLAGKPVKTLDDAWTTIQSFHDVGCRTVVLSSAQFSSDSQQLTAVASTITGGKRTTATIDIPLLNETFTGTGDLFSALFLAWMAKTNNLYTTLENTVATLQSVLKRTLEMAQKEAEHGTKFTRAQLELRLIQSKGDIENPDVKLKAKVFS